MKALKRKLNSRQGASILLALLFFLLCIMVGASVLAAAASNAGKIKSNKEEQQKYLTLSSAVNLLIDELESVEYVGRYKYVAVLCESDLAIGPHPIWTPDLTMIVGYLHGLHRTYTQWPGTLRYKDDPDKTSWLHSESGESVLPFVNDLDYIFNSQFYVPAGEQIDGDLYTFNSLSARKSNGESVTVPTAPTGHYTLDLKANVTGDYGGLTDKVRVIVELRTDGSIKLTATLLEPVKDEDGNITGWIDPDPAKGGYTMKALLRPDPVDDWPEKLLVLPNNPTKDHSATYYETKPIRWKLEYIFKKEADPSATPTPP